MDTRRTEPVRNRRAHRSPVPRLAPFVAAAGLALAATLAPAQPSTDATRSLQTAHGMLNRGLFDLAADEYRAALANAEALTPGDRNEARYGLGVSLFRLGETERALEALDAIEAGRGFRFAADSAILRAHALYRLSRFGPAAEAFESFADRYDDHASAPGAVATGVEAWSRAGEPARAVRLADQMGDRVEDPAAARRMNYFRGVSHAELGQHARAIRALEPVASAEPADAITPHAALRLASSYIETDQGRRAEQWLARVEQLGEAGTTPSAMLARGQLLRRRGIHDQAKSVLLTLRERFPAHRPTSVAYDLGRAALALGEHADARSYLDEAVTGFSDADDPLEAEARYWRAKALLRSGQPGAAAEQLETAIERFPEHPLAGSMRYDRAVALERSGEADEARRAFAEFRARHADNAMTHEALGVEVSLALNAGELERTIDLARRFLDHPDPGARAPAVAFALGEALYRSERYRDALEVFESIDAGSQSLADRVTYRIGMTRLRVGDTQGAVEPLAEAAALAEREPAFIPAIKASGDAAFALEDWPAAEQRFSQYLEQAPEAADADDALLRLGLSAVRQDEHARAIPVFERLLTGHLRSVHRPQARFELGQSLATLGRDAEAAEALESLLREHPGSRFEAFALRRLGAIASRAGDASTAADFFARAGAAGDESLTDDDRRNLAIDRARAQLTAGDAAGAARTLEDVAGPDARAWRVVALSRAGEHDAALRAARRLPLDRLEEASLRDLATFQLGLSRRATGDADGAAAAFDTLLNADDTDLRAHATLEAATLRMEAGELDRADALLRPLVSEPASLPAAICPAAVYQAGWLALERDEPRRAIELLAPDRRPCALGTYEAPAELTLGEAYLLASQPARAAERFERALALDLTPESEETALLRWGEALAQAQRFDDSRVAFERHRRDFADSDQWFRAEFGIGWAHENARRPADAIVHYRRVATEHRGPTAARAQFQLGECLFAMGELDEAVRELVKVDILHNEPEWSAAALYEAGRCFEQLGKIGEARAQYRAVADRFGDSRWAPLAGERLEALARPVRPGRGGS